VSPDGWILAFGFRVFYVGLLIVWLMWFFRLRDDDDEDPPDDADDGGSEHCGPSPRGGPGGGGIRLPTGRVPRGNRRTRDGHRPSRAPRHRRDSPALPSPLPPRVRLPLEAPAKITRR